MNRKSTKTGYYTWKLPCQGPSRKAPNMKDRQCISITTHANLQTKVFWNANWAIPFVVDT